MKTIETELKKYRMCRAEMDRSCGAVLCIGCPYDLPSETFRKFVAIDHVLCGESPP